VGRFDEALAAAKPSELGDELPLILQGRAAWVEARRGNYSAAIAPMQALVSAHPDYYWGWQQLADWYNETDRPQNYLEAAGELVRLRPDHPVPLAMRGEAKIKLDDRDGGKEDLREALRLNPRYAPAAAVLFDACLDDGELRDARAALAVLQEHLTGPEVAVKQLQLHARTNDEDGAGRAFAEVCEHDGETNPGVVKVAYDAMRDGGFESRAVETLKAAWQAGRPFNPWAAIFWVDSPAGLESTPSERLAALDATVTAYPDFAVAYDRKAEILAEAGRFDEAMAACAPVILGQPPPVALRGRAAWVVAERGDRSKAITLMQTVLTEDPNYVWGWRQLAGWAEALGRSREHLTAAGHLVRLSPDDPLALLFRGEARRNAGDRVGAREDFRRAYDLDPNFELAGIHLIGEQLAANDVAGAVETLRSLKGENPGPLVRLRAVQVAAANHDGRAARTEFRALAADPTVSPAVLREAATALDDEGWTLEADDVLAARATDPDAPPAVATLWAEREVQADRFERVGDKLPLLAKGNPPAGRAAVLAYAWGLVSAGRPEAAAAAVQRFNDLLRADDDSWARAGAVLAEARHFALAAAWLADWPNRVAVEGWMLRPLADSLRALDRDAEALTVCRSGLAANPPPDVAAEFRGWLALAAAEAGEPASAANYLKGMDQIGLPDSVKLVLAMAEAVLMVKQAGPDGKVSAFGEAKEHLRAAADACPENARPPGTVRWFKRVVARLGADAGTVKAKVWASWQRVRPWVG
jgi:predicted Zn-dependent protease